MVSQVTTIPASQLARVSPGQAATPLRPVPPGGPALTIGGKPVIVFVGEESCPFCAAERWPLVVALAHFGTWSHLGSTTSSATDVFPNTATFSFRTADYTSRDLTLRTTELTDNLGRPLQAQTQLDTRLIGTYDVPPYVNSADQSGAVPFLDIANHDILAGAQYNPPAAGRPVRPPDRRPAEESGLPGGTSDRRVRPGDHYSYQPRPARHSPAQLGLDRRGQLIRARSWR